MGKIGGKWETVGKVATSGGKWLKVGKSAEKWGEWLRVVKNGEKLRKIATCKWQYSWIVHTKLVENVTKLII